MKIETLAQQIKSELQAKLKDVTQLKAEAKKLQTQIKRLEKTALYGNIILKDKKYNVFVSKMVDGKRIRKQLGTDPEIKEKYEQGLNDGLALDDSNERLEFIYQELKDFQKTISSPQLW